jgi:hypothetical protein
MSAEAWFAVLEAANGSAASVPTAGAPAAHSHGIPKLSAGPTGFPHGQTGAQKGTAGLYFFCSSRM